MLQGAEEMRCEGDMTCPSSGKCAGAWLMCGTKAGATPLFSRAQVLCVQAMVCVQVDVVLLLLPVGVGSMMRIVVMDVDVD